MKGDLELYRIFYTVAKHSHMSKAAEELFISQPAVSQSIKKLEEQIGSTLFIRSNKGLTLTEEGKMIYSYVKPSIESIASAENELTNYKDLNTGKIRIGISTVLSKIVLLEALEKFHKRYPKVKIDITNELTSKLINELNNGLLDFVILNEGDSPLEDFNKKAIKNIDYVFIANNDYKDLKKGLFTLKQLNSYPLILQKKESNTRKFLDSFALDSKTILNPYMEVVSAELVIELSKIGLGVGFAIKGFVEKELESGELFEVKLQEAVPNSNILLVTNKNLILTYAAKEFIKHLD